MNRKGLCPFPVNVEDDRLNLTPRRAIHNMVAGSGNNVVLWEGLRVVTPHSRYANQGIIVWSGVIVSKEGVNDLHTSSLGSILPKPHVSLLWLVSLPGATQTLLTKTLSH